MRRERKGPGQDSEAQGTDHQGDDECAHDLLPTHGRKAFERRRLLAKVFVARERVETREPRIPETRTG